MRLSSRPVRDRAGRHLSPYSQNSFKGHLGVSTIKRNNDLSDSVTKFMTFYFLIILQSFGRKRAVKLRNQGLVLYFFSVIFYKYSNTKLKFMLQVGAAHHKKEIPLRKIPVHLPQPESFLRNVSTRGLLRYPSTQRAKIPW